MPTVIVMPQLGESVAEGVIGKWLKNEGDRIEKDEPIVEVITDKVNAEIPSPVAGFLATITQPEGATVAVGGEIAIITDGSDAGTETPAESSVPPPGSSASFGNGQSPQVVAPTPTNNDRPTELRPHLQPDFDAAGPVGSGSRRGERVRSSPLVRRLAEQHNINLSEVPGTGIGGRVSKQDILSFVEQTGQAPAATAVMAPRDVGTEFMQKPSGTPMHPPVPLAASTVQAPPLQQPPAAVIPRPLGDNEEAVPVPPLRKIIAERMVHSVFTIPHATTNAEVDMTNVVRFRDAKKDEFRSSEGVALSLVAFVIKATVEALKEFPMVNAEWAGDSIILKKNVNINIAVDAPEGLTIPVIHHADERSLAGLSKAIFDLAMRARNKKLKMDDMQGGTFTVNNTGALGSVSGVSIINYPQGGILSSGTVAKRPVVVEQDGQDLIAIRSMMNLSFTFDHRLLDGGYAAAFVNAVKRKLETWPSDYPVY